MWAYPIAPIFHFCDYEVKTFKRLAKLYNTPAYLWKPVLKRFVDIHKQVTQKAIMPVESYALKPIARWLGFDWRDAKANGASASAGTTIGSKLAIDRSWRRCPLQ